MSGFKYIESRKVSKAQKRRQSKAARESERLKRIEEGEEDNENKDRQIELEKLDRLMGEKGFKIHDIDADGDCMYKAVEHQLKIADDSSETLGHQELRQRVSEYMLKNCDNFLPFLLTDQGDLMDIKEYEKYCDRIANTKDWGGHMELTAIAEITGKPIHIYQAENKRPILIEPQRKTDKKCMLLSFHKHLYHLGEHYNSVVPNTTKPNS